MEPKKNIKKLDTFKLKKDNFGSQIMPVYEPMLRHRSILDLGQYGEYLVNSEIPRMSFNRFGSDYFGEMGFRHFNESTINPIRVIIRDIIREGDLHEWASNRNYQKINATLKIVDPTGTVVTQYLLLGCLVNELSLDFTLDGDGIYELIINMDHFTVQFCYY